MEPSAVNISRIESRANITSEPIISAEDINKLLEKIEGDKINSPNDWKRDPKRAEVFLGLKMHEIEEDDGDELEPLIASTKEAQMKWLEKSAEDYVEGMPLPLKTAVIFQKTFGSKPTSPRGERSGANTRGTVGSKEELLEVEMAEYGKEDGKGVGSRKEEDELECALELEDEKIEKDAPPQKAPKLEFNLSINKYALGDASSSEDDEEVSEAHDRGC